MFQLSIEGIDFVAHGGGNNKKEAEAAAAREFLSHLVETGHMPANSVPPNILVCFPSVLHRCGYLYL